MDCELVTVGTELLLGAVVDGNAATMGRLLAAAGIRVTRRTSVGDAPEDVKQAVRAAMARSGTVIVSGGLGPTRDDVTRQAVAEVFGRPLRRDPSLVAGLEAWYRRRGVTSMPASNLVQADVPDGATILPNPRGTAPGLWLDDEHGRCAVLLPGVPKELAGLMADEVVPRLTARARDGDAGRVIVSATVRTTGIGESALHDRLGALETALPAGVSLAWLPSTCGTDLRLTAWDLAAADAADALARGAALLRERAGPFVYGEGEDDLAEVVLAQLAGAGDRLAVAESCTGGLVGARLTAVPGSSRVFAGGVIAYDNDVKLGFLGVSADALAGHGAVSEEVARQMAAGAARAFGVSVAVAVTGIAGPDGGSDDKPVGTVWIAVHRQDAQRTFRWVLPGDRDDIRQRAAQLALDATRRVVAGL